MNINEIAGITSGAFASSMGSGNGFKSGGIGMIRRNKKKAKESVYAMNKDDPNNPEVVVQGYGRLSMNGLKRDVTDMLTGLAEFAERDDWERVEYEISKGTFMPKLTALVKALEDLESVSKISLNSCRFDIAWAS